MKEYIEREAAVKAAQDGADEWDGSFNRNRDTYIEAAIDKVYTADVQKVRHAKWVFTDMYDAHHIPIYECTNCHKEVADVFIKNHLYCLHCGAKMDLQ